MNTPLERCESPAWLSRTLFPYESRYTEIGGHRVHYVDEGAGPTLLLLHGNPTWSFLYRDIIHSLRSRFRCIALDYPGFGLSRAATGYDYLPRSHAGVVERFVQRLALKDIALMVQDWGGPIGLWVAGRDPERFGALVIGNTWGSWLSKPRSECWKADGLLKRARRCALGWHRQMMRLANDLIDAG